MEVSSTKIVKCNVFRVQETLFAGGSFPVSVFHGQSQINGGARDRKSRVMSFTKGEARRMAKLNLNTRICAIWSKPKDLQQTKTGSEAMP